MEKETHHAYIIQHFPTQQDTLFKKRAQYIVASQKAKESNFPEIKFLLFCKAIKYNNTFSMLVLCINGQ